MPEGPAPINLTSISDKTLDIISAALGLDKTKVQPEEWRTGIVEELGQMMVYTSAGVNNEKLAKAALTSWENLQTHPSFYTAPPNQEFGHVLTGGQITGDSDPTRQAYGDNVQYENLQRYVDHLINAALKRDIS